LTSLQQLVLAHVTHAVSPGAGGHALPPLPVEAALELALVLEDALALALEDAAELLPDPVHSAWQAPPTHCPNCFATPLGMPQAVRHPCVVAPGCARQPVQQMQLGSVVQAV
jgi:hypothetical protein